MVHSAGSISFFFLSWCVNGAGKSPRKSNKNLEQDVKCGKGHAGVNCLPSVDGGLLAHHISVITGIVSLVTVCVKTLSKTPKFFTLLSPEAGVRGMRV